jgi:hypothetical protein
MPQKNVRMKIFFIYHAPRLTATLTALYKKDKAFRRYAAGVERALALWDTAQQEWADYISFLGRLLKVNTTVLPYHESKRLYRVHSRPCNRTPQRYPSFHIAIQSHCD